MYTLVLFGKNINSRRNKFPELTFNGKESCVFLNDCTPAFHPLKSHHLHSCLSPWPSWMVKPSRTASLDSHLLCEDHYFSSSASTSVKVASEFSSHISCHLHVTNPTLLIHSAVSSSPLIQILFLLFPENSGSLS